jgi:effector-binding domain-containing protein
MGIMKLTIGEFSRISFLSVKSLRLYHEKEILIPAEVDEFTGYRYYNEANYDTARSIKILKEFDFSLSEIKEILIQCDQESDILEQLHQKLGEIKNKIDRYNDISRSIESIIKYEWESKMKTTEKFEVEEKEIETVLVAGHRMKGKYHEVEKGFKLLGKAVGRHINGKPMNLYYDGEYKEEDADFEPCFPVRKGTSTDNVSVRELPGGKAVTLIHKGPYEELTSSYKIIIDYINKKEYKTKLPSREVYLKGPGMIFKGNPNNYLTEIQFILDE